MPECIPGFGEAAEVVRRMGGDVAGVKGVAVFACFGQEGFGEAFKLG